MSSYDELPYEDIAYYHTHPSNLAVVATLCGLHPPAVEKCRVLELGCGTGFNLLAMSHSLPHARFVGVDLSSRQIEQGKSLLHKLNIDHVQLHARDVADLDPSFGEFDYIIAHGLFSWVPPATRQAILRLCKRHLAPQGIAYLSYNTYPGWHTRAILRDALRFHAPQNLPLLDQVRKARDAVAKMVDDLPDQDTHYAQFLRSELQGIKDDSDIYLAHEFLEPHNQPFHFEEIAQLATSHGLRFLAEARFETNSFTQNTQRQQSLAAVGNDLVRREQYHDYLRNRYFRQSLFCHAQLNPTWSPQLRTMNELRLRCQVEPLSVTVENGNPSETFRLNSNKVITTADPILRSLLNDLQQAWPAMTTVANLIAKLQSSLPSTANAMHIAQGILQGYLDGFWQLFAYPPPYAANISACPVACPLARLQAEKGDDVTNRLHRPVKLTEPQRLVLQQLDGTSPTEQQLTTAESSGNQYQFILQILINHALLTD